MTETIEDAGRFFAAGDLDQAARVCLGLIAQQPTHFDALHLLGVICTRRGQGADAVCYLLRAERTWSDHVQLQTNIGNAFGLVRRFDDAIAAYRKAEALGPPDPGLLNNLGLACRGAKREAEAVDCFRAAITIDPAFAPGQYNLGQALFAAGKVEEAVQILRALLAAPPPGTTGEKIVEIADVCAFACLALGRGDDALALLDQVAAIPDGKLPIEAHRALTLLTLGRLRDGFAAYEGRWRTDGQTQMPKDHIVLDLDDVAGKRVLIAVEQGRGDMIQCLRYMKPLAARGARIRLCVYPDLIALARELPDVEQVLGPDDVTDYERLTSIMSLPLAFGTDLTTIPSEVPYLRTPAARVGRMRHHLGPRNGLRVGVAWSGSSASYARSAMPASALEPLLRHPDVAFHALQKDIRPDDRAWIDSTGLVTTHDQMLDDFADTAALIDEMDLVISIDTSVAHLAGALAKPVWILLPFNPDWRWMLDRADSPWYPTARLFRQTARDDWSGPVHAAREALDQSWFRLKQS